MGADAAAQDFTFLALFLKADWVVKSVMIGLVLASVWSWAVIIDKWLHVRGLEKGARDIEGRLASGQGLEPVDGDDKAGGAMGRVLGGIVREWRESHKAGALTQVAAERLESRADRLINAAIAREVARAERGLGVLATIGSSAPFIGLFGTVWGIMNAFRSIAASRDTSLAVVAPGIAEALFATALGLFAAIPATIFYNKLAGDIERFAVRLETLADEAMVRLSRRLSEGG
jgi:biopolymer transport protein TolQ